MSNSDYQSQDNKLQIDFEGTFTEEEL